jgi:hypothetical protein
MNRWRQKASWHQRPMRVKHRQKAKPPGEDDPGAAPSPYWDVSAGDRSSPRLRGLTPPASIKKEGHARTLTKPNDPATGTAGDRSPISNPSSLIAQVIHHGRRRIALVAPTAADARDVMVEGESGLLAIGPPPQRPQ